MWLVAYYDTVVVNSVYEIISFRFYLVLKGYSSDYYVSVMGGRKGQDLSRGPDIYFFLPSMVDALNPWILHFP